MNRLRIYFENQQDGGDQSNFLSQFGTKDTQDGICFNLVLKWLQLYNVNNGAIAPNVIFRDQIKQPDVISQIAKAQSQYLKEKIVDKEDVYINRYGLGGNIRKEKFFSPYDFVAVANHCLNNPNYTMMEIGLYFENCRSGHSVGIINHNNRTYLYDPNVGVMSIDNTNRNEVLSLIPLIYGTIIPNLKLKCGVFTIIA